MNTIKNILVIIASIAVIVYISDTMATKYKTDENMISCSYAPVEELLIDVALGDAKESLMNNGFIVNAQVNKDNTITKDRKMTIGNKAIYKCFTTIEVQVQADPNNSNNLKLIESIANKNSDTFVTTFDREFTVEENDMGTSYWVSVKRIMDYEIQNLF